MTLMETVAQITFLSVLLFRMIEGVERDSLEKMETLTNAVINLSAHVFFRALMRRRWTSQYQLQLQR